jgi:Protein of unknown function (DUF2934)
MAKTAQTNKRDFRNRLPIRYLDDGKLSDQADGRPKPLTDFYGEDRHELVQKLAYQYWEKRGSPLGSPEIDWFAAEKAVRAYLLASGIELGPDGDLYS